MNVSVPSYQITSPVIEARGDWPQLHPQYAVESKGCEMSSDVGHQSSKRPRMSEILPSSRMPMVDKANPSNFQIPSRKDFDVGIGNYEGRCSYSPAFYDTDKPLPSWQGIEIQEGQFSGSSNVGYGTSNDLKVCRMFHNGKKCTYGDQCRFLHEIPEKIKKDFGLFSQSYEMGILGAGHIVDRSSGFDQLEEKKSGPMRIVGRNEIPRPVYFKTRLCYNWQMTGRCPYEKVCRFAHGEAELQKLGSCSVSESRGVHNTSATTLAAAEGGLRSSTGIDTDCKNQVSRMKQFVKSNKLGKLIGIYADWLED